VEITDAGRFATLTLNRPHAHNALNDGITGAIQTTLTKLRGPEYTGLRAVFIKAVGPTFCGGGDLKDFVKSATDPPHENHVRAKEFAAFLKGLNTFPKPVVALVSGSLMIFCSMYTLCNLVVLT
jgi:enoyl-CoA hydratase/carnithine racemase